MSLRLVSACLLSLLVFSCKKSGAPVDDASKNQTSQEYSSQSLLSKPGKSSLPSVKSLSNEGQVADRIFFDFDDASVRGAYLNDLTLQAQHIKKLLAENPNLSLIVEGNCDERGGVEYNIALGHRRANAAKDVLVKNGIPAEKIKVVSFGKERKLVEGTSAVAYLQNRAAITKINM